MKKLYFILILAVLPILGFSQGIAFVNESFAEAMQKAKQENKLVFIDAYAVWCGPCKRMAKTVFLEEEVGRYFDKHFVSLKIDVERGEGPDIKNRYGISGLPGYVILDDNEHVIYRFSGAMPTERFMEHIKKAVSNASDKNSLNQLAADYEKKKNDELFLRMYLNKLHESNSTGYTDVLEQYLSIQKRIQESDKEMVMLLANHSEEIIFGGKADEIIQRNYGSDAWKQHVRKNIRDKFQKLPRKMVETTTNYAIAKKDTAILELVLNRAHEAGVHVDENQRKRTYTFYYLQTGQGDQYKKMVYDQHEAFVKSLDVEDLRNYYQNWKKRIASGDSRAKSSTPHAVRKSAQIASMVFNYAKFAQSEKDKSDITRWMKVAYDIVPGDSKIMSQYASILYLFGNKKSEAVQIMEKALQFAKKEDNKNTAGIKADLDTMKANGTIYLK